MHIEHEHSHEHTHSHEHPHDHSHTHEHPHTHSHEHTGEAETVPPKTLALLKYMLEHNKEHARELSEGGLALAEAGNTDAARLIGEAVHFFDHGNESLEQAVDLLSREV